MLCTDHHRNVINYFIYNFAINVFIELEYWFYSVVYRMYKKCILRCTEILLKQLEISLIVTLVSIWYAEIIPNNVNQLSLFYYSSILMQCDFYFIYHSVLLRARLFNGVLIGDLCWIESIYCIFDLCWMLVFERNQRY